MCSVEDDQPRRCNPIQFSIIIIIIIIISNYVCCYKKNACALQLSAVKAKVKL